jgi:hypothetical protein
MPSVFLMMLLGCAQQLAPSSRTITRSEPHPPKKKEMQWIELILTPLKTLQIEASLFWKPPFGEFVTGVRN